MSNMGDLFDAFILILLSLGSLILGLYLGHSTCSEQYITRLKAAGLAYHDTVSGELLINLPEQGEQQWLNV